MRHAIRHCFTLIELMIAMSIFCLMMLMMFEIVTQIQDMWRVTAGRIEMFDNARFAFDTLQRDLSAIVYIPDATYNFYRERVSNNKPTSSIGFAAGTTYRPSAYSLSRVAEVSYMFDEDNGCLRYRLRGDIKESSGNIDPDFDWFNKLNVEGNVAAPAPMEFGSFKTNLRGKTQVANAVELIPYVVECNFYSFRREDPISSGADNVRYEYRMDVDYKTMPDVLVVEFIVLDRDSYKTYAEYKKSPTNALTRRARRAVGKARRFVRMINLDRQEKIEGVSNES